MRTIIIRTSQHWILVGRKMLINFLTAAVTVTQVSISVLVVIFRLFRLARLFFSYINQIFVLTLSLKLASWFYLYVRFLNNS